MAGRPETLDCWVLAGQSNMEGVGALSEAPAPDDRVWCFTSAGAWEVARDPLHWFWESYTPVHQRLCREWLPEDQRDVDAREMAVQQRATRVTGAGLGIPFGVAMAEATGRPIGLIAAAHGGTSLAQWNSALKSDGGDSLYGAMLDRIARAGGTLRGILWYQGESDGNLTDAPTYADRFAAWVEAVRVDTDCPELPVIAVQLGRFAYPSEPNGERAWELIREAQALLPMQVPHTAVAGAIDLGLQDIIHISTAGHARLGRRMALLAQRLATGVAPTGPCVERIEHDGSYLRVVCGGVTGGWNPCDHISGFSLHVADGGLHPTLMVVNAGADPTDPTVIRILLNGTADADTRLGYGLGFNPYCNAVDDADMALCAFLPKAAV